MEVWERIWDVCHLQILDVIQSSKFPVKFGDAVPDFFYLEGGDRFLFLMPSPHKEGGRGRQLARVLAGKEGNPDLLPVWGDDAHTPGAQAGFTLLGGRGQELFQVRCHCGGLFRVEEGWAIALSLIFAHYTMEDDGEALNTK